MPDWRPALILVCASFLQGFSGFGYSLLALPLLLWFMPPGTAVPMLCVTALILNGMILLKTGRSLEIRSLLPLAVAGAAFTPVGAWLIREVPAELAKTVIGIAVALLSMALLLKTSPGPGKKAPSLMVAGAFSGLLNGFSTFSGPPVLLVLAGSGEERDRIRSCLAAYFLFLGVIALLSYSALGVLTPKALPGIAMMTPFTVTGALAGIGLASRTGSSAYRRAALLLMAALGILSAAV